MSNDARRKEKQRLKREKKKAQHRRALSVSPYRRIGEAGQVEACYINADWSESGLASIHIIRRNPAGGHAMACFLVDVWCAGLKDAWGRIDLMQEDIDHNLKRARENFDLERIEIGVVRNLVAGSIKFAAQNGFKLPVHYDRWIKLLGGVDVQSADLSQFGRDGKLMWVGPMDDLRQRLIGCTLEEFLKRQDVQITTELATDMGYVRGEATDDEDDAEFEQAVADLRTTASETAKAKAQEVRKRCADKGADPHQALDDALKFTLAILMLAFTANADTQDVGIPLDVIHAAAEDLLEEAAPGHLENGIPASLIPDRLRPALQQMEEMLGADSMTATDVIEAFESRQITDSAL